MLPIGNGGLRSVHQFVFDSANIFPNSIFVSSMKIQSVLSFTTLLILASNLAPTAVHASSLNAKCLLEIDGTTYMDDRCNFTGDTDSDSFSDLRLLVICPNGVDASRTSCTGSEQKVARPGVFGYLFRQKGVAFLCWNMGTMLKASPCFEGLRRSGACWSNPRAKNRSGPSQVSKVKFCAWAE
jgi:hypothetical protein